MGGTFDRELKRILVDAGCHYVRPAKGSHEMWYSPISGTHFPVPTGIVSRHTANGVLKEAGLPRQEFRGHNTDRNSGDTIHNPQLLYCYDPP
jgi:hypothetical protein